MRWFKSRSEGFWWVLSAIVVSVVGFILLYVGWEWLRSESQESRGTTIRNAFLIIGGLVAVLLAIWRSRMSERQTQVSNEQTKAALKQAGISHQSLLNERFQNGAEMLGSNTISVRLGGIYALTGCGKTLLSTQGRKLSDDKRRPIACSERIIRIGLSHAECRRDS